MEDLQDGCPATIFSASRINFPQDARQHKCIGRCGLKRFPQVPQMRRRLRFSYISKFDKREVQ
jgi:hypothetical protein